MGPDAANEQKDLVVRVRADWASEVLVQGVGKGRAERMTAKEGAVFTLRLAAGLEYVLVALSPKT